MNRKFSLIVFAVLAAVAILGAAGLCWLRGELRAERARLAATVHGLRDPLSLAELRAETSRLELADSQLSARREAKEARTRRLSLAKRRELTREFRSRINRLYFDFAKSARLSPVQYAALRSLLTERLFGKLDDGPGISRLSSAADIQYFEEELARRERSILGNDGYAAFENYDQTVVPVQNVVGHLQDLLAPSGLALSIQQAAEFAGVERADAANDAADPASAVATAMGTADASVDDTVVSQARPFLSAPQLAVLQRLAMEQATERELGRSIAEIYR